MKRNVVIYVLSLAMVLPLAWLILTTELAGSAIGWVFLSGGVVTAGALLRLVWQAHAVGRLLPNRCVTCDHPMVLSRPGELRPPSGTEPGPVRKWRCRHCGRLAEPLLPRR